eukprot:g6123.t1
MSRDEIKKIWKDFQAETWEATKEVARDWFKDSAEEIKGLHEMAEINYKKMKELKAKSIIEAEKLKKEAERKAMIAKSVALHAQEAALNAIHAQAGSLEEQCHLAEAAAVKARASARSTSKELRKAAEAKVEKSVQAAKHVFNHAREMIEEHAIRLRDFEKSAEEMARKKANLAATAARRRRHAWKLRKERKQRKRKEREERKAKKARERAKRLEDLAHTAALEYGEYESSESSSEESESSESEEGGDSSLLFDHHNTKSAAIEYEKAMEKRNEIGHHHLQHGLSPQAASHLVPITARELFLKRFGQRDFVTLTEVQVFTHDWKRNNEVFYRKDKKASSSFNDVKPKKKMRGIQRRFSQGFGRMTSGVKNMKSLKLIHSTSNKMKRDHITKGTLDLPDISLDEQKQLKKTSSFFPSFSKNAQLKAKTTALLLGMQALEYHARILSKNEDPDIQTKAKDIANTAFHANIQANAMLDLHMSDIHDARIAVQAERDAIRAAAEAKHHAELEKRAQRAWSAASKGVQTEVRLALLGVQHAEAKRAAEEALRKAEEARRIAEAEKKAAQKAEEARLLAIEREKQKKIKMEEEKIRLEEEKRKSFWDSFYYFCTHKLGMKGECEPLLQNLVNYAMLHDFEKNENAEKMYDLFMLQQEREAFKDVRMIEKSKHLNDTKRKHRPSTALVVSSKPTQRHCNRPETAHPLLREKDVKKMIATITKDPKKKKIDVKRPQTASGRLQDFHPHNGIGGNQSINVIASLNQILEMEEEKREKWKRQVQRQRNQEKVDKQRIAFEPKRFKAKPKHPISAKIRKRPKGVRNLWNTHDVRKRLAKRGVLSKKEKLKLSRKVQDPALLYLDENKSRGLRWISKERKEKQEKKRREVESATEDTLEKLRNLHREEYEIF